MRVYIILGLVFVLANAEKKINLEDIERDNLRAENNAKAEDDDGDEVKYAPQSASNQQHYEQSTAKYSSVTSQPVTYSPSLQLQNVKYDIQPQEYKPSSGYSVNEFIYSDKNSVVPEQNIQPVQYYNSYRQQAQLVSKKTPVPYHPQRFLYQPEVVVGNQIQSIRQKAATQKYLTTANKGIFYVDVPMTPVLSYYPLEDDTKTAAAQSPSLLQQLPTDSVQQISFPVYAQLPNQKQYVTSARNAYQTQQSYAPAYVQPVTYYPKFSKPAGSSVAAKKPTSPVLSASTYAQQDTQPKKYLYTEAYLQPQTQYLQHLLYNQAGAFYTPSASFYADLYAQTPVYLQDNSLQAHANQYSPRPQQLKVPSAIIEQLTKQIAQSSPSQDYEKTPDEPRTHFVPPQYTAEDFKPAVTRLTAISSDNYAANGQDEPRSLLDTYVPSKIIAAQDSSRYRERPIQLESGFLPSKLNFVQAHKKRTAN